MNTNTNTNTNTTSRTHTHTHRQTHALSVTHRSTHARIHPLPLTSPPDSIAADPFLSPQLNHPLMDSAVRPAAAAAADEEEARRRSTDCIYFLASPLTCKKGSECEYRHSDAARVNPRDCWYWFNGNCTNPKCAFRHPPLDDLLGAPATPRAAQPPVPQVSVPAQAPGSVPGSGTAKQGVPCYYFQKGTCLKGNKCAFLHMQQTAGSTDSQQTAKASTPLQAHPQLKNTWMMKACTKPSLSAQQNTPAAAVDKLRINGQNGKPAQKQNPTTSADYSSGAYQNHHLANHSYVLTSTAENYQPQRSVEQDLAENGMEVGEFVREPSAGMGVLVGGTDDTTNHSFMEEDNSHRHSNGELATKYERELRTRMLTHTHNSYEVERPERSSTVSGRRISQRDLTHHACDSSDLRHRLRKQRQLNDTRSAQVTDRHDEYLEERSCDNRHWQDEEQVIRDTLSRSRLHGRIKLPGVTSSDGVGFLSEKERDRGPRVRLSPPKQTDLRGKLHSRLGARLNEDIPGNAKGLRVKPNTVEDAGSMNFAGPKTLAELKASKVADFSQEQASKRASSSAGLGRVSSEIVAVQESSSPVPFEGPKPLNVILKRKREATSENATHFDSIQDKHAVKEEEPQNKFGCLEEDVVSMDTKGKGEEEASFHPEDDMAYDDSLSPVDDNTAGAGVIADQELEPPQDLEPAEEYDYDAADGNAEEDNEYQEDEDDDDDFARKVGVMIS